MESYIKSIHLIATLTLLACWPRTSSAQVSEGDFLEEWSMAPSTSKEVTAGSTESDEFLGDMGPWQAEASTREWCGETTATASYSIDPCAVSILAKVFRLNERARSEIIHFPLTTPITVSAENPAFLEVDFDSATIDVFQNVYSGGLRYWLWGEAAVKIELRDSRAPGWGRLSLRLSRWRGTTAWGDLGSYWEWRPEQVVAGSPLNLVDYLAPGQVLTIDSVSVYAEVYCHYAYHDRWTGILTLIPTPYSWQFEATAELNNLRSIRIFKVDEKPTLELVDAKMVSPNELGIGIKVLYPESYPEETPRKVKFSATINGRYVEKEFDITEWTVPGEWRGVGETLDANGKVVIPTTPLRINLADEEVTRFTQSENFELVGVAYCEDGPQSEPNKIEVEIPLPVVVLHGYIHKWLWEEFVGYPLPLWSGGAAVTYLWAYRGLHKFLCDNGYNPEKEWPDFWKQDLIDKGYSIKEYKTLWDPIVGAMYTNPSRACPGQILGEMNKLVEEVRSYSYAERANFVGHSFGGLVARYYALEEPEKVNKVITVGTPHKGISYFFEVSFKDFENSEEASEKYIIQKGPWSGQFSALLWIVPKYQCLYDETGRPILFPSDTIPFENTLIAEKAPGVKYFSIFSSEFETSENLTVREKKNGWYEFVRIKDKGKGDGYILATSASAVGLPLPPVEGYPHHFLCNSKQSQGWIVAILKDVLSGAIAIDDYVFSYFKENIKQSEVASKDIHVEHGVTKAVFDLVWQGSDLDLVLYDPNGNEINPEVASSNPNIDFIEGDTYEQYTILNPTSGKWTMEIRAMDVPEEGEEYVAVAHLLTNQPPVANAGPDQTVEQQSCAGTQVTLDASCSTDLDSNPGTNDDIVSFDWYEGDILLGTGQIIDYIFPLGTHTVTLLVTDTCGEIGVDELIIVVRDTTPPEVEVVVPQEDSAVQDGITLTAEASDITGINEVSFYIREPNAGNGVPIGQEDLAATFNPATGKWECAFDTTQLQDGYYIVLAKAVDVYGNEGWSEVVPFSIRNWAVIKLLPATPSSKAGRTMPVKFSIRIAQSVDPAMPFVYNEDLEIRIYKPTSPSVILQRSLFGPGATDYRIDTTGEKYITNFKTSTTPATYVVEIWRPEKSFKVGSFTFKTVK